MNALNRLKNIIISAVLLLVAACASVPSGAKTESPKARFVFLHKNGLYGLLDENGNEIVPAEYLHIDKIRDGMIPAYTKEKVFVFLDESGKKIKDVSFYDINPLYTQDLLGVADSETGKWGFVDKNLNYVIEPQFDAIGYFVDGIVGAKQGELWGIINKSGKYIFEPQFKDDELEGYDQGTLVVSKGGKIRLVDVKKAEFLETEYDELYGMTGGKAVVGKDSSIYLNSWENKEVFLMKKPSRILYDMYRGNVLGKTRFYLNYREDGEKDEHFAVFDSSTGEKICDKIINSSYEIDENCNVKERYPHKDEEVSTQQAEENEQKKYGKYEEVRHSVYDISTSFKQNGKWGFLDEDGNVVIPAEYDSVSPFYFDAAYARQGDRRFIIDRSGRKIVEIKPEWEGVNELRYTIWEYYEWVLSSYCFSDRSEYWYGRERVEKTLKRNKPKE